MPSPISLVNHRKIIAGEFIELSPELKPISSLSKLSKYFLCLIAAFNCAWLHLGNFFAGQNTPAGGKLYH